MILVERFWKSFAKAGGCDIDIIIELGELKVKFPCHRRILMKESDVFKMKLSKKPDCIKITDMDPHIMFLVLSYMYGKSLSPAHWKTTADLLHAAVSYRIANLYQHCVQLLLESLDLTNACSLLEVASAYSIAELYASSHKICVDGAFHVLESEDFATVLPSTVISIVSDPNLNVPNETYVLYALWMRATVDLSRNDAELCYGNLRRYFEPYSAFVQYADVDQKELESFGNKNLTRHFGESFDNKNLTRHFDESFDKNLTRHFGEIVTEAEERIYPAKRRMRFPLGFPTKFYVRYSSGEIVAMSSMKGQTSIEFSTEELVYLIEFRMTCCYKANASERGIKRLAIIENGEVVLAWNIEENNNSKLSLTLNERTVYTANDDILFQEFRFSLEALIKLRQGQTYGLAIESFSVNLMWPELKNKVVSNCPIKIHSPTHPCLTKMTLLPCPTF